MISIPLNHRGVFTLSEVGKNSIPVRKIWDKYSIIPDQTKKRSYQLLSFWSGIFFNGLNQSCEGLTSIASNSITNKINRRVEKNILKITGSALLAANNPIQSNFDRKSRSDRAIDWCYVVELK